MKKITLMSLMTVLLSLFIVGCGSNTRQDPIAPGGGSGGATDNGYELTNVTTPFDIGYAGQQETFQVQLIQEGIPVSGKPVSTASLPSAFGFITKSTVETNEGGYAIFDYTAADPLTNGSMPLDLIYDDNGSKTTATLTINVLEGTVPFDYKFVGTTTPVEINQVSQPVTITSYLMDKDNNPQKDKLVTIAPLDVKYGSISPIASLSTEAGLVSFNYIAPADLTGLSSTSTVMRFTEGENSISQAVEIVFKGSGYSLSNATTPIVINNAGQTEEISVYLVDESNVGVAGESVSITPVPSGYGTVTPGTASTDETGKAVFTYTAPEYLVGLTGTRLTLSYFDGTATIATHVDIQINSEGATGYALVNAKDPYYVYSIAQTELFDIQLIKDGSAVVGTEACSSSPATDCVAITALDRRFGSFTGVVPNTASDGYAYFSYVAPADAEKASNGEDSTFTAEYIDKDGKVVATSAPITIRMRY